MYFSKLLKLLGQWFLTWVRSNPRGSVSQFQGFGGLVHPTRMIRDVTLCLAIIGTVCALIQYIVICICFEFEGGKKHILFFQLRRVR